MSVPAVILILHAIINFMPTRFLALWNGASTVWHIIGTFVLIILLPAVAPTHQTSAFVFTEFDSDTSASGVPSSGRVIPSVSHADVMTLRPATL